MKLEFVKTDFKRKLARFGLEPAQVDAVCAQFEKKHMELDVLELVSCLERFGFSRSAIMFMLRALGLEDQELMNIFSMLQKKRMRTYGNAIETLEVAEHGDLQG